MTRTEAAFKNIFINIFSNGFVWIFKFISRTIFVKIIGLEYLGLTGLYANIFGLLSFVELGIGPALNFSLYKPVAEKNIEKIKSLMALYKKAYRYVALLITIIGLVIMPFLRYIIKGENNLDNIHLVYLFFLFESVISYFAMYKTSLLNAEQKNYVWTAANSIFAVITIMSQIIVLVLFKNFIIYLAIGSFVSLIKTLFAYFYLDKLYPFLKDKKIEKLDKTESVVIRKNILALVIHRISSASIHQTDSILIASFINLINVGILSNYNMFIGIFSGFLTIGFISVLPGFGNLAATTDKKKQLEIFNMYNFVSFWLYGFSFLVFFNLGTPFIILWLGDDMKLNFYETLFVYMNFYLAGYRSAFINLRMATGSFMEDKYLAIFEAFVNLFFSIVFIKIFGLVGVFIGTFIYNIFSLVGKPLLLFKKIFGVNPVKYYIQSAIYILWIAFLSVIIYYIDKLIFKELNIINFIYKSMVLFVASNFLFYIVFKDRKEFTMMKKYLLSRFKRF